MTRRIVACAGVVLAWAVAGAAQTREPIGRFVVDVRGVSAGLPTAEGWTAAVPAGTVIPSRGLGLEVGGHVYVVRLRGVALGIGGTWLTARGSTSPEEPDAPPGQPPAPPIVPDLRTRVQTIAPQLSLNFGHSLGWSYLSAGLGRTRVRSEGTLATTPPVSATLETDWVNTLNYGGGARWFINDHVGVGFDLRWHRLSALPAAGARPGAPRATLFVAGAGLVLK